MVYNTCCACGRKIVQSERNEDACDTCGKVFCRSCLTLKSKLEMTASQRRQKSCVCQRFMDMKDCRSPVAESELKDITQKCDTPNDTSNGVSLFVKDKVEAIVSPDYETDRKTEILESSDGARSSSSYRVDSSRKKIDAYSSPGRKWLAVVNKSASIPDTAVPQKPLQREQLFTPGEIFSLQAGEDTLESSDPEQPSVTSVPEKEVVLDLPYLELLHTPGNNDWFQLANGAFESSYHEHLLAPDSIDSFHVPDDTWESPPNEWLNAFGNIEVEDTFRFIT
ncbi:uncharacterized protein LOC127882431 [Dreissena polymorpha]|uniref:Uncharacterized protein n=1 Tax=Dreissena polymorpha TaxID=45954 RepID=A0A9D4GY66_DREPO|nr:uncharacterized protein LOC127882431 [Dreissena polymorpha]XP_052287023.1 uncharacterized protein LOC127882431 [Dreissena polymorpha]XP_052287024.1 uncharacterized protein LOC127882431 [Dreissena polymorpha]KAH3825789.1 hypothetical protein DPMN_127669 [Dreissena polymorpha]